MRELLIVSKEMGANGLRHSCDYYIVIDQMEGNGVFACESYGVKIVGPDGEEAVIPNITVSISRIDELLELLQRNSVTPVALRDVVDDWL